MPIFTWSSVSCCRACSDPRLTAHIASLGPPACDRGGTRVPIRTALVVFAIVRLAGDAANAAADRRGGPPNRSGPNSRGGQTPPGGGGPKSRGVGVYPLGSGPRPAADQGRDRPSKKTAPVISDFGKMSAGENAAFSRESKSGSSAELIMLLISIPRVPVVPVFSINGEMDHCVRPLSFLAP